MPYIDVAPKPETQGLCLPEPFSTNTASEAAQIEDIVTDDLVFWDLGVRVLGWGLGFEPLWNWESRFRSGITV